jgi:hypothetical protein
MHEGAAARQRQVTHTAEEGAVHRGRRGRRAGIAYFVGKKSDMSGEYMCVLSIIHTNMALLDSSFPYISDLVSSPPPHTHTHTHTYIYIYIYIIYIYLFVERKKEREKIEKRYKGK